MKIWPYLLFILFMIASCSGSSSSQNLTWYNNSVITNVSEDPEKPEEFTRVSIGISPQIFYLAKKSDDYKALLKKTRLSHKNGKPFNIGIENNTNIIRQINEIH
ncbi:hypothetical protein [Chryseobacterium lathyri]|uniref:hypothetical protein n=1 Tax=Chryseobacterium lathyri TaxID=395933 RepID=UPI002785A69B|nr:hypothetical protein [Chryseobacterium lathyri]MDQ0065455.1 hypothetical protein [Chryseobacterium lathyri]